MTDPKPCTVAIGAIEPTSEGKFNVWLRGHFVGSYDTQAEASAAMSRAIRMRTPTREADGK